MALRGRRGESQGDAIGVDRASRRVLLAGVGGDAHCVGLIILRLALMRAGYVVDYLGVQSDLDEVCEAACDADAVLISNMDGHAWHYLSKLQTHRARSEGDAALWYLGGNPTLDGHKGDAGRFHSIGFDRVYLGFVEVDEVIRTLDFDLKSRRRNVTEADRCKPKSGQRALSSALIDKDVSFEDERRAVLDLWPTGQSAANLDANAVNLAGRPCLAKVQARADGGNHTLVQPRSGVASCAEQTALFRTLSENSADVLSFQIDSLTRNNDYGGVEAALSTSGQNGRLNGFPAVNHGPKAIREIVDSVPDRAIQARHSTRDPRLLAEICYAGGVTAFEGGPICYNLPYFRDYDPSLAIARWRYVDHLTGLYYKRFGIILDREFFGVLTATLVPPCIAIASDILEALLACEHGVVSVSLGYAEQGNRIQDVAAIQALRRLGREELDRHGFGNVAVHTVFHQYMGAFPTTKDKAKEILIESAVTGGLSRATRMMTKTFVEAIRIPTTRENVESLDLVRSGLRKASSEQLDYQAVMEEQALIECEVRAILDCVLSAYTKDTASCVVNAIDKGLFEVPFSPSCWNKGQILTLRDLSGAVRFLDTGNIPFTADVIRRHADKVSRRRAIERSSIDELIETDIRRIAEGRFSKWPLDVGW